MPSGMI